MIVVDPLHLLGALAGGYGAAGVARRIGKKTVRGFVIFVGISIAAFMFYRMAVDKL